MQKDILPQNKLNTNYEEQARRLKRKKISY